MSQSPEVDRRDFIKVTGGAIAATAAIGGASEVAAAQTTKIAFAGSDSLCHGPGWETFNLTLSSNRLGMCKLRNGGNGNRISQQS